MDIFLDPTLKGQGYGATLHYENQDGYISLGHSSRAGHPIIVVVFRFSDFGSVTIIGGENEVKAYKHIAGMADKVDRFMWSILHRVLDEALFKDILRSVKEQARLDGRRNLQQQFKALLKLA